MKAFGSYSRLKDLARRGLRGYPMATVAYYGPDASRASKVAVSIILDEDEEPEVLERWFSDEADVRFDPAICDAVLGFIEAYGAKSVVMSRGLLGCPHEETIDYPPGEKCPKCPYWADEDRWAGEFTE